MINKKQTIIKRALISVFDKTGVLDFALNLTKGNIEILSSGGTAEILRKGGVNVLDVSDYTSVPEIMDGRVKTINPLIEGGILGLRDVHNQDATDNDIKWIDLVVCNFYPFSETVSKKD